MHSILVVIEPQHATNAPVLSNQRQLFHPLMQELLETHKNIDKLGENVLLIPVRNELFPFSEVCRLCFGAGYPYRCVFFEEAPKWVPSKV